MVCAAPCERGEQSGEFKGGLVRALCAKTAGVMDSRLETDSFFHTTRYSSMVKRHSAVMFSARTKPADIRMAYLVIRALSPVTRLKSWANLRYVVKPPSQVRGEGGVWLLREYGALRAHTIRPAIKIAGSLVGVL